MRLLRRIGGDAFFRKPGFHFFRRGGSGEACTLDPVDRPIGQRSENLAGPAIAAAGGGTEGEHGFAAQVVGFHKGLNQPRRLSPPDGKLKYSPSPTALENTGLNGKHKCVLCTRFPVLLRPYGGIPFLQRVIMHK